MFLDYNGPIWDPLLINVKSLILSKAKLYCNMQSCLQTWGDHITQSQT